MTEQINFTVFDKLLSPVKDIFEKNLVKCSEDKRSKKLNLYNFIRILVFCFVKGCGSLGILVKELKTSPYAEAFSLPKVGKSTIHDAFARFPDSVFFAIFVILVSTLSFLSISEINELGEILITDGSYFKMPKDVIWAKFSKQAQAIQLHLCYSLNKMIPVKFIIDNGKSCQKKALIDMIGKGITYIGDRNYVSSKLFGNIINKEAFFIIRTKENLSYKLIEELTTDIPNKLRSVYSNISDYKIILKNTSKELRQTHFRLVILTTRNNRYFLLTNRFDLSTFYIILLYAYRWQIELFFRLIKRTKKGLHLLNHSPDGVKIHFYALFITLILELYLKEQSLRIIQEKIQSIPVKEESILKQIQKNNFRSSQEFIELIGKNLSNFKMSIYWLTTLQNLLAKPYDLFAVVQLTDT